MTVETPPAIGKRGRCPSRIAATFARQLEQILSESPRLFEDQATLLLVATHLCATHSEHPRAAVALLLLTQCDAPCHVLMALEKWMGILPTPMKGHLLARASSCPPLPSGSQEERPSSDTRGVTRRASVSRRQCRFVSDRTLQLTGAGTSPCSSASDEWRSNLVQRCDDEDIRTTRVTSATTCSRICSKSPGSPLGSLCPQRGVSKEQMPPKEEVMKLLRKVAVFEHFEEEKLEEVFDIAWPRSYGPEEVVTTVGLPSTDLHIVVEGTAKVSVPRLIGFLDPGSVFGEESLRPSGATCPHVVEAFDGPLTTICISASALASSGLERKVARRSRKSAWLHSLDNFSPTVSRDNGRKIIADYVKTDADREMIIQSLKSNNTIAEVLQLSDEQYAFLASAMHLVAVPRGQTLVRKDSVGSALYIIHQGVMHACDFENGLLNRLRQGDSFGELSMLYDAPRAMTMHAVTDCLIWVLPRLEFTKVAKIPSIARTARYAELVFNVPYLRRLVGIENREMVAEALEEVTFRKGDTVCVEGGDRGLLFIILQGQFEAYKGRELVRALGPGDWVGEEQLEKGLPAELSVYARTQDASVLVLDAGSLQLATRPLHLMWKSYSLDCLPTVDADDVDLSLEPFSPLLGSGSSVVVRPRRRSLGPSGMVWPDTTIRSCSERRSPRKHFQRVQIQHDITKMVSCGLLGKGSFGHVLLMMDVDTQREYALKVIIKSTIVEGKRHYLLNERRVMSILDSDFVVKLLRTYQDSRHIFFLLEAITGGDLFETFVQYSLFGKLDHVRFYIACAIVGLQHMHDNKVVYRDLKLDNCIRDTKGYIKLTDMGIAKIVFGKTYTVCGTADYLAPETLKRLGHNRAVDWWACGILLFIMAEGRSPFDAPDVTQIYKNIIGGISKVKFSASASPEIVDVITALCQKGPEDRVPMQKGGVTNLMQMAFFNGLDWDRLSSRDLAPPFVPLEKKRAPERGYSKELDFNPSEVLEWDGTLPDLKF